MTRQRTTHPHSRSRTGTHLMERKLTRNPKRLLSRAELMETRSQRAMTRTRSLLAKNRLSLGRALLARDQRIQ